jgi:CubicO group peptidase (beta-lactamase class C family)
VPPGTKWAYANHGFALLGEVIMRKEEAELEAVLRRRCFDPLGMADSDCRDEPAPELTTGYHRAPSDDERALRERAGLSVPDEETVDGHNIRGRYQHLSGLSRRASGAVQSTIPDMARYASALLRKSAGIVRPETFDRMLQPQWCPDDRLPSLGLSFFRQWRFGRRAFEHGGGVAGGWNTLMSFLPDEDTAVLIHLNLSYDRFDAVQSRIIQAVLDAPSRERPQRPVDPALLAAAPGVYEAPLPGPLTNFRIAVPMGRLQISARDGALWLHARRGPWKGGVPLRPADDGDPPCFLIDDGDPDPPRLVLVREATGAVTRLRIAVGCAVDLVRNDAIAPWA